MGKGDAVKHSANGEVAVVLERLNRRQVRVSRENRTVAVWYVANLQAV